MSRPTICHGAGACKYVGLANLEWLVNATNVICHANRVCRRGSVRHAVMGMDLHTWVIVSPNVPLAIINITHITITHITIIIIIVWVDSVYNAHMVVHNVM